MKAITSKNGLEYITCRASDEAIKSLVQHNEGIEKLYFFGAGEYHIGSEGIQSLKELKQLKVLSFDYPRLCF